MEENLIHVQEVMTLIHLIRGEKVILDNDLARLYGVTTKALKQAVRRNIERFPEDFMFELSREEYISLRSQIVTLKNRTSGRGKHTKYNAFAFTEQGIAMLSSVLNSSIAIQVNIQIIRAFVRMRKEFLNYEKLNSKVDQIEIEMKESLKDQNEKIEVIFEALRQLIQPGVPERRRIGYKKD